MIKCLVPKYADKFLEGLKKGEINPSNLIDMSSQQRRDFFTKYVGEENAKFVNTRYESTLLLKDQQAGLIRWAESLAGIKESTRNDIISKIKKLEKALDVTDKNKFLEDIIEQRLGVNVDIEDARIINDLTQKMRDTYATRFDKPRSDYFKYKQELLKFIRESAPDAVNTTTLGKAGYLIANAVSVQRAIKTAFDFSAALRQGLSYFGRKEWNNAFVRMFDYARRKTAIDELEVDMISNKNSDLLMKYKKQLGLTLLGETFGQREEAFASKLVEKVPLLKGSARAYEGFLNDLRFHRFVNVIDALEKSGNSIKDNPKALKDLAEVIASSTGRGNLGKLEVGGAAGALSTVLFSPRFMMSRIQTLFDPIFKGGTDLKSPARFEAAKSLATSVAISMAILAIAKMAGEDVEEDPTSSDYGKLKVGKTKFDFTGGLSGYVTFLARQLTGKIKNSNTGIVSELNGNEFNAKDRLDLFVSLIENKTSPIASIIRDYLKGKTFDGKPINLDTPIKEHLQYLADALFVPLLAKDTVNSYLQGSDNNSIAMGVLGGTASFFGIGANTYEYSEDWDNKDTKELSQFKEKVGVDKFKQANENFNKEYSKWLEETVDNKKYQDLSDDNKRSLILKKKRSIKDKIFNEYKFRYKKEKSNEEDLSGLL